MEASFESLPIRERREALRNLARLRRRCRGTLGFAFRGSQRDHLLVAIRQRAETIREPSWWSYLGWLWRGDRIDREMLALVPLVTNHESYFFRHPEQIAALRRLALEPYLESPQARPLRIWSAGCASGEEPYSLAIEVQEHLGQRRYWPVEILGTDVDVASIERARLGLYDARALRSLPRRFLGRHFAPETSGVRVLDAIRQRVRFDTHNLLLGATRPEGPFDVIFCRNVLIYFGGEEARRALRHMVAQLVPGGLLILGPVESVRGRFDRLVPELQIAQDGEVTYYLRRSAFDRAGQEPTERKGIPEARERAHELAELEKLIKGERLFEALGRLEMQIQSRPDDRAFRWLRAKTFAELGRLDAAARDAAELLRDEPVEPRLHRFIAEMRFRQGRFEEAATFARRAIYLEPEDGESWLLLGRILDQRRDHTDAARAWWNASELISGAAIDERSQPRRDHLGRLLAECRVRLAHGRGPRGIPS
ncbi:MAG: CheR family methyltransferase [Planctomycetota bacterium]